MVIGQLGRVLGIDESELEWASLKSSYKYNGKCKLKVTISAGFMMTANGSLW